MTFCCCDTSILSNITPEGVLAFLTFFLVIVGIIELSHIHSYIKLYANTSNDKAALNTIMKQLEFHYKLLDRIRDELKSKLKGVDMEKKEAFEYMYKNYLEDFYNSITVQSIEGEDLRIMAAYEKFYGEFGSILGNYFKNLYSLIKYVDDYDKEISKNNVKSKKIIYYINLVKSQLSKFEILLLAYNCVWIMKKRKPVGENFIEYASEHNILSALETVELLNQDHIALFSGYSITFDDQKEH